MGMFKGSGSASSNGGGDDGGGGIVAQLFRKHGDKLQGGGGGKQQYTYDADSQKYNTSSAPTDGTPAPAQMKKGGTASSRADGCATKGKTKGRMV